MKRILCLLFALMMLVSLGAQALAEDVLYCRMCGRQIPADSKVCPYCGEKVVRLAAAEDTATENGTDTKPAASATRISAPSPATAAASGPFGTAGSTASNSGLGKVRVTKSPTSENVPYGGSCMFIAHAANATSVTWYIANADTSVITTAAEAPGKVSGLSVSGASEDTLILYGIPSWMNGCQVQACFNGEGGPVYTEIARIWTYDPAPRRDPYEDSGWWDWWKAIYWHEVMSGSRLSDESDYMDHSDMSFDFNPADPWGSGWSISDTLDDDQKEDDHPAMPDHTGSNSMNEGNAAASADEAGAGVDAISMTEKDSTTAEVITAVLDDGTEEK